MLEEEALIGHATLGGLTFAVALGPFEAHLHLMTVETVGGGRAGVAGEA